MSPAEQRVVEAAAVAEALRQPAFAGPENNVREACLAAYEVARNELGKACAAYLAEIRTP